MGIRGFLIWWTDARYHLKDVIVGKIYFLLVRINIKHMELSIIRRETTGAAPNMYNESETITKFEIMDGSPVRGGSFDMQAALKSLADRTVHRRDDTHPALPRWLRADADVSRCEQKVFSAVLPESRIDRL